MMKKLLQIMTVLIFCCCITLSAYAESSIIPEEGYDVRKVRWGMSLEEIKKSENGPMFGKPKYSKFSHETKIQYRDKILGIWCDITYEYKAEKGLYNVKIYFVPQQKQIADNIYNIIINSLMKKYINSSKEIFTNDRTVIHLNKYSSESLEKVTLTYYSMSYWNELEENSKKYDDERKLMQSLFMGTVTGCDVRNARWDMTKEEVKNTELANFVTENDNELIYSLYNAPIGVDKWFIHFYFVNDRLLYVTYQLEETSKIYAARTYHLLIKELNKKYAQYIDNNATIYTKRHFQKLYRIPSADMLAVNDYEKDKNIKVTFSKANNPEKLIKNDTTIDDIPSFLNIDYLTYISEGHDVRNVFWGMTKEQVEINEPSAFIQEEDKTLAYWLGVINISQDCYITYYFENENLEAAIFILPMESKENATNYYQSIVNSFDKKYARYADKNAVEPELRESMRIYRTPRSIIYATNNYDDNKILTVTYAKQ